MWCVLTWQIKLINNSVNLVRKIAYVYCSKERNSNEKVCRFTVIVFMGSFHKCLTIFIFLVFRRGNGLEFAAACHQVWRHILSLSLDHNRTETQSVHGPYFRPFYDEHKRQDLNSDTNFGLTNFMCHSAWLRLYYCHTPSLNPSLCIQKALSNFKTSVN